MYFLKQPHWVFSYISSSETTAEIRVIFMPVNLVKLERHRPTIDLPLPAYETGSDFPWPSVPHEFFIFMTSQQLGERVRMNLPVFPLQRCPGAESEGKAISLLARLSWASQQVTEVDTFLKVSQEIISSKKFPSMWALTSWTQGSCGHFHQGRQQKEHRD